MNHRFAWGIVERSAPSMLEPAPPVTREITLAIAAGPENVADSPVLTLKSEKL